MKPRPAARGAHHHYRRWTTREDRYLREPWGFVPRDAILAHIGRSWLAIYWRAQKIGVGLGAPQGREYLTHAAKRTGYDVATLRRILAWGCVDMVPIASRARTDRPMHHVDPIDVDEAIALWHRTETPASAVRQRGDVCRGETLRKWLRAAGVLPAGRMSRVKRGSKRKPHERFLSTDIDRVIAERAARETLHAASERTGISRQTLAIWLRAIGLRRATKTNEPVRREDIDRAIAAHVARRGCRARARVREEIRRAA